MDGSNLSVTVPADCCTKVSEGRSSRLTCCNDCLFHKNGSNFRYKTKMTKSKQNGFHIEKILNLIKVLLISNFLNSISFVATFKDELYAA